MREADFDEFRGLLDAVCGLLSRGAYATSPTNTALWFRALSAHDLPTVKAAFDAHVKDPQRGRFVPTPADIIAQIAEVDDGRPGAEEAWAMVPKSEAESAVWTTEASQAFGVAVHLLDAGDKVAARMAFKETYLRMVTQARSVGRPVEWMVSLGHDPRGRDSVLTQAVEAGRISLERARGFSAMLPAPRADLLALAGSAVQRLQ